MKPLNLLALLLFLAGTVYVFTWSERTVRKIQETYYATISPFLKGGSKLELATRRFLKEVEHSEDLEKRLEVIELEFGKLRAIESQFRELERENRELRANLDFKERTRFDVVPARIIKRRPSTWLQSVTIDRGGKSGIGTQVPVLANGGLAGKVDQVFPNTDIATVILLTDESCQVSVQVAGTPEVGIVSGQRGAYGEEPRLRLRYLSKNAPIRPGMSVVTTGRGKLFPPNILVGTIESFEPGPVDSEALVKPSVDFVNLEIVFVISESGAPREGPLEE
ncbi:MAG: rod shape-determining protein MreC [Akkermansiaceae bacterium]|nr:rod shape-determining protein MreC [Akkermansiaceae bacterium]NNM29191.1 rod shape-determining protein MreC [Akkermansiaceae bacterium]